MKDKIDYKDNKEKIRLAINQIPINNCDGSANEDAIKAVRYLQEVSEAINYTHCYTELPTSTQLLSDCKKRFKELEGKGNLDYRSYQNGYLDCFRLFVLFLLLKYIAFYLLAKM